MKRDSSSDDPQPAAELPLLLKPKDVARQLSISRPSVYRLIARGLLPSVEIGRNLAVKRSDLEAFIHRLPRR